MEITFKKGNTKDTITCKRPDGTSTWMAAETFMVTHDLTHYVVEINLNIHQGFYGLLAQGIDITDFEKKQKISPASIPADGIRMEILVGLFLTERNDGRQLVDFNAAYRESCQKFHLATESLPEPLLQSMRRQIGEIIIKWHNLPVGNCLVFNFPAS